MVSNNGDSLQSSGAEAALTALMQEARVRAKQTQAHSCVVDRTKISMRLSKKQAGGTLS